MEQTPTESLAARAPEVATPPPRVVTPGWGRVVATPVLDLFRPRAAAACLVSASRPAFAVVLVLSLLGYAAVIIGLMLWAATVTRTWPTAPATQPTTAPGGGMYTPAWPEPQVESHTLREVWADWRRHSFGGWLGPAESVVMLVLMLGVPALSLLAWLNMPLVHGVGSIWSSFKRSFRASAAILWPLAGATLASGVLVVRAEHAQFRGGLTFGGPLSADPEAILILCIASSAVLLVTWLRTAVDGAAPTAADSALPPRCEGCGYDLTHQPVERRCPECGLDLDASLIEERSRPGYRWSRTPAELAWWATSYQVLRRPQVFYRALKLRTPARHEARFARRHYLWIAFGALVWACGMFVWLSRQHGPPRTEELPEVLVVACAAITLGVMGCWLGHRVIAALVVSYWLARGSLPDFRWAAKVMAYETTFLWVFCGFWGVLLGSFTVVEWWLSALLGSPGWPLFWLGMPVEAWMVAGGTLLLTLVWLWRYTIAYRAIRWSNF